MKLLFLINDLGVGGAENMLLRYCREFVADGHDVRVFTMGHCQDMAVEFTDAGVQLFGPLQMGRGQRFLKFLKMVNYINRFEPDVISSWLYRSDFTVFFLSFFIRCTNIGWNIRTSELRFGEISFSTFLLQRLNAVLSYWKLNFITYNSQAGKNFHESVGYNSSIGHLLSNGFDTKEKVVTAEKNLQFKSRYGISETDRVILYVGRHSLIKDIRALFEVIADIDIAHNDIKFLICGAGFDDSSLKQYLGDYHLKNSISFLGLVDDISLAYENSDVLLLTSFQEGFPNVVAEAMLNKVICITFDVGDCRSIISDDDLVCYTRDVSEMSEKVSNVLKLGSAELLDKKNVMQQRIETNYSLIKSKNKYIKILASGKKNEK